MKRIGTTPRLILAAALVTAAPGAAHAQQWNSRAALALARHATAVRQAQLADTALRTYKAEARGYLTFLAQLGSGFPTPPRVVRTDQIASDVYWKAPASARQFIKGRRDTLLLPTDIAYHRDHLGIVQNNFPSIIRIGEGDEVSDVPHPLSRAGLEDYDFAIGDSLRILLGPRTLDVLELRFRPRNPAAPRALGSVYVDRASGTVVRMSLSFTRAALNDPELEDITVVLENGLIDGRFWLPRRQDIEIRRTGTWLKYPARGIIRGRWEISDYEINAPVDFAFAKGGPEIQAAPGAVVTRAGMVTTPGFHFQGGILDSLPPDVRTVSAADVAKVRAEAAQLVAARAVMRTQQLALAGRSVSEFVHANRAEGTAVGAGASVGAGPRIVFGAGGSYGFSDHLLKPHASVAATTGLLTTTLRGYRRVAEMGDIPERSGVINSLAAQNFGSDYTDPYYAEGAGARLSLPMGSAILFADGARERQWSAALRAVPASGRFAPVRPVRPVHETRISAGFDLPAFSVGSAGTGSARVTGSLLADQPDVRAGAAGTWWRGSASASLEHAVGRDEFLLEGFAAAVSGGATVAPQHLVYLGGPQSAPGYDFHSLVGARGTFLRAEWRAPVPFVPIPLGAWGPAPASLTLAPYVNAAWVDGRGWRPSVGLGALTIFDLVRLDVARGLRGGRWVFNLDVSWSFWPVL